MAVATPSAAGAGSAAVPPLPVPGARAAPFPRRGARVPPSAVARTGPGGKREKKRTKKRFKHRTYLPDIVQYQQQSRPKSEAIQAVAHKC